MSAAAVSVVLTGLAATSPASAATSAMTDAFVAAVAPAYGVLRQSDDLALAAGGSARTATFARRDSAHQAAAFEALVAWSQAEQRTAFADAQTPSIDGLGPILYPFDAEVVPLNIDGRRIGAADQAALAQLRSLRGPAFDSYYAATEAALLERLARVYVDYIKNGDDPTLRLLAVRNLPKVRQLIAGLRRLRAASIREQADEHAPEED